MSENWSTEMPVSEHVALALADARAAVERSDKAQLPTQQTRTLAVRDETRALRDALRALIQAVEALNA